MVKKYINKFKILLLGLYGELIKILITLNFIRPQNLKKIENRAENHSQVIISLTCYGSRVNRVLFFCLVSLFR